MEARASGRALKPDYGDFILPPAAMRRTHQQFRDCGDFPRFPKKKVWAVRAGQEKRRPLGLGGQQRVVPTWISTADSSTWEEVSREKGKFEDVEGFAFVGECVMKSTAGGCSDHERCDLCDYGCDDGHVHHSSHGKTEKERHLPDEGCGRCIQPLR